MPKCPIYRPIEKLINKHGECIGYKTHSWETMTLAEQSLCNAYSVTVNKALRTMEGQ